VIEAGQDTMAMEVKAAARFDDGDLGGLRSFLAATPRCRLAVLAYNGATVVKIADRIWAIPMRHLLG
jgi:hypothetical protein